MKNIRLISAGAGTGKTFTLTGELSKKLSVEGYQPSQIIATTFTKAAAGELKSRTREKLLEENKLEQTAQLEQALIGTVNSISHQLLSLFSFESGLSPKLTVIDDEEKDVLFQESLSQAVDVRTWNKIDELALRFSVWRNESKLVIKLISDFARNNAMDKKALEASRDDSISSLKKLLPKASEDEDKAQIKIQQLIKGLRTATLSIADTTGDTIKALKEFDDFRYRLLHRMYIPWADWADCAKQKCGAKSATAGIFDEVQELMKKHIRFPGFQNDLVEYITLCFDAAITSMDAYDKMKKERGLVDFVDQESLLMQALDEKPIQKRFREQFKILFVDEFQDTSPLQLSLFLKISSLVEKVIWV
ncbi:MAG: UvrD-helicase domain-containing protein, partial [Ginsengibacter sp.]